MKKSNNNKKYGLIKERELKKKLETEGALFVTRQRGSFGFADLIAFYPTYVLLVSCKATRSKYYNYKAEIRNLESVEVPHYCLKSLYVFWSPHKERKDKKGWVEYEI